MCYLRRLQLAALSLALITPLGAQQGDRKGHNMASFVPEDVIPPAPFLNVEQALKSFQLAPGFVIEEVASEPLVDMPCMLKFDGNGQMWVKPDLISPSALWTTERLNQWFVFYTLYRFSVN